MKKTQKMTIEQVQIDLQNELAYFEAKLELDKQQKWDEYVAHLLKELNQ